MQSHYITLSAPSWAYARWFAVRCSHQQWGLYHGRTWARRQNRTGCWAHTVQWLFLWTARVEDAPMRSGKESLLCPWEYRSMTQDEWYHLGPGSKTGWLHTSSVHLCVDWWNSLFYLGQRWYQIWALGCSPQACLPERTSWFVGEVLWSFPHCLGPFANETRSKHYPNW